MVKNDKNDGLCREIDWFQQSPERPFFIDVTFEGRNTRIWVGKELYDVYDRERMNEKRRLDRESRCLVEDERLHTLVRCQLNCEQCPYKNAGMREGMPVSPEFLMEEYGMEITGGDDVEGDCERAELIEALHGEMSRLPERDQRILWMLADEAPTRMIAKALGVSQTAIQKKVTALTARLRKALKDFR